VQSGVDTELIDRAVLLPLIHYQNYKATLQNFVWLSASPREEKALIEALSLIEAQSQSIDARLEEEKSRHQLMALQVRAQAAALSLMLLLPSLSSC
jgi:hypothetical protein